MITIPNFLSFMRIPLAFVFLLTNPIYRCIAIIFAALSDFFDGFLARRYKMCSRIGTTLDPVSDKFFVAFAIMTFIHEDRLTLWQTAAMLGRDISVMIFGGYLILNRQWEEYKFRSILSGKITTTLQFIVLFALTMHIEIPNIFFINFAILGIFALFELYFNKIRHTAVLRTGLNLKTTTKPRENIREGE